MNPYFNWSCQKLKTTLEVSFTFIFKSSVAIFSRGFLRNRRKRKLCIYKKIDKLTVI